MAYALVDAGTIQAIGGLPVSARRLDDGAWVMALRDASVGDQQATGWYEVQDTPKPPDTPTTINEKSTELVAGIPTVVWTERDKTQEEIDTAADNAVRDAEGQALKVDLELAKTTRDESQQSRADLVDNTTADPGEDTGLAKWQRTTETFDDTLSNGQRIANLEAAGTDSAKLLNNAIDEFRKMYADHRKGAVLDIHSIKSQRLDLA